jgi:hypothetical protein
LPDEIQNSEHSQRLENLKSSLRKAYVALRVSNRKSHGKNKEIYDKEEKRDIFVVGSGY